MNDEFIEQQAEWFIKSGNEMKFADYLELMNDHRIKFEQALIREANKNDKANQRCKTLQKIQKRFNYYGKLVQFRSGRTF